MAKEKDRYALSAWRGEFLHQDVEGAYREHVKEGTARHLIVALRVWAFLLVSFGWLDYIGLGLSEGFYHLLAMRLFSALLLLGLSVIVRHRPELAKDGGAVSILEAIGFLLFFIIYFVRPDIVIWNIGVTVIILISLYIFIPNRLVNSNVTALFGILGTLYCLSLGGTEPRLLVGIFFLLSFPAIVGYFASRRLNLSSRQQYALFMETVQVNQSLQAEIKRREELEVELKLQATTDPLTGLLNRRQYETLFRREQERVRRHAGKLSLCVTDLDHFKKINDDHGHDVGDQVLKHISDLFVETLRHTDIVGRFGGEEFILLLPDTDLDNAMVVIDRLREKLQASPVEADDKEIRITATFAVTEVNAEDVTIEDVIRRADKALYRGKEAGRNQVVAS
ncbi:GGDEF domain-containing protein [Halopseudomonas sp.]|uniref:GGDEF domain-containing protein n=1 Tax=Halopseudomonas sp. TaxID=2901191 RepID=UPI00356A38A1